MIEVLVSVLVFSLIVAGIMLFFVHGWNFANYNTGKLGVNKDIRIFTTELSDNATYANYFIVYDSFANRVEVNDGLSGDFLVLVYRDPDDEAKIEQLVGYYRSALPDEEGPVRKFDLTISPSSDADLATLLPGTGTNDTHEEVIEISKGLADGQLFYNFYDRSIMVRGEILHYGSTSKRATNTYNFTVSPRG